jgi:hypothetical protein
LRRLAPVRVEQLQDAFDVAKRAEDETLNRTLVRAARFINMHARGEAPASAGLLSIRACNFSSAAKAPRIAT